MKAHLIVTRIIFGIGTRSLWMLLAVALLLLQLVLLRLLRSHGLHALALLLLAGTHRVHAAVRDGEATIRGLLLLRVLTPQHAAGPLHGQVFFLGSAACALQLGPLVRCVVRIHNGLLRDVLQIEKKKVSCKARSVDWVYNCPTYAAAIWLDAPDETILLHRCLVDPLASLGEQLLLLAT